MKISFIKISLSVIALSALMAACYPGGPEYVSDYDVVYTLVPDQNFDFSQAQSFHVADTIMDLSEPGSSPPPISNGKSILSQTRSEMLALGYTQDDFNNADYILLCSVVRTNNYQYTWWGGWGGWPGWGWGGCCYYPPVTTVSNYRTGSLIIQMVDAKSLDPDNEIIPIVWQGTLEGLFEGTNQYIQNRTTSGISQMFDQSSSYLKR